MMTVTLPSHDVMPMLGLGTWGLRGAQCTRVVRLALDIGYRHIDTAEFYGNHTQIGAALAQAGVPRNELFITTKIPPEDLRYDAIVAACERYLIQLKVDYLDLLLLHWPNEQFHIYDMMRALGDLVHEGKARNVGVSNFTRRLIDQAVAACSVPLATNQVEFHPFLQQPILLEHCRSRRIILTAYCPLAKGKVQDNSVIQEIARQHNKLPTQVSLRWLLQKGLAALPKSGCEEHLITNLNIFDFELTVDEVKRIDSTPRRSRIVESLPCAQFDE